MSTRAVVAIALLSALLGALVTGWVLDRRGARERARLVEETAVLRHRADSLDGVRAAVQARADSAAVVADSQSERATREAERARALGHRTAGLEAAVAAAATVRDSVDRLVDLAAGLREERDQSRASASAWESAWAAEREARVRLTAVVAATDSVLGAERARNRALEELLAKERAGSGDGFLGLSKPLHCGPGVAVTHRLEGRVVAGCVVAM